jgi:[CysO sulfur-carrier protein]-S-L-cysteine hydrolase
MTTVIEIERRFRDEIVRQAIEELPNEACGLIAAKEGIPVRVFPIRNADHSATTYRFEARDHFLAEREMEDEGLELFAIYHSHTHTEAYPSPTDRNRAFWEVDGERAAIFPDALYLIVSLADRDDPVLRAFRIGEDHVTEEEVRIE